MNFHVHSFLYDSDLWTYSKQIMMMMFLLLLVVVFITLRLCICFLNITTLFSIYKRDIYIYIEIGFSPIKTRGDVLITVIL